MLAKKVQIVYLFKADLPRITQPICTLNFERNVKDRKMFT